MRLLVLSDLHVELAQFVAPAAGFDLVILAGDIHNGVEALSWARRSFPDHPIVQIAGNHEYYDHDFAPCLDAMREAARRLEIEFLENDRTVIRGVEFLGCTLWTDFRIFESGTRPLRIPVAEAMLANIPLIADYHAIDVREAGANRPFRPEDAAAIHRVSRRWLERALGIPATGPRVVVTHHLPSWRSVAPAFERAITNAAFVTDLEHLIGSCDLWIHGHTHSSHRYRVGTTDVVCNPRGYPRSRETGSFENRAFDPALVMTVAHSK